MMQPYIPIKPRSKAPIPSGWQNPDADIEAWWRNVPEDVNKALRLDGLLVLDFDTEAAYLSFRDGRQVAILDCPIVKTPRGWHIYWTLPEGIEVSAGPIAGAHTDVKSGPGHYVLVPDSVNAEGVPYRWASSLKDPHAAPVAPPELLAWVAAQRATQAMKPSEGVSGGLIPTGTRNVLLTSFAGLLRRHGADADVVGRVLNGLNHQLTEEPLPDEEVAAIVRSSERWEPDPFTVELIEEGEEEPTSSGLILWSKNAPLPPPGKWLWEPYLPEGRFVLLDGLEGIGKGMFAAYIAVAVANGTLGEPGNVLWASAEDDPEEDIFRRLRAAGLTPASPGDVGFFTESPYFPRHADVIAKMLRQHEAKLLILDPGRSYLTAPEGVEMSYNNDAVVRHGLESLVKLAKASGTTVLFIHHWNKDSQGSTRSRAGGTGAFVQVPRQRLSFAKAGTGEGAEWAFAVTKSNIRTEGHLRTYSLPVHEDPSLDTATFVLGPAVSGYPDLGTWAREREKIVEGGSVMLDPADVIAQWAAANLPPDAVIPSRENLAKLLRIPQPEVTRGLQTLVDEKAVIIDQSGAVKRHVWRG